MPSHLQQIKMSNTSVTIVLSKYSTFLPAVFNTQECCKVDGSCQGEFVIVISILVPYYLFHIISTRDRASHYGDVVMGTVASQITSLTIVYSTVYSDADQRKHQSSASLAFVWGIHRGPVNSPHKWPVTRKMFPFDDVIMANGRWNLLVPRCHCDLYKMAGSQ